MLKEKRKMTPGRRSSRRGHFCTDSARLLECGPPLFPKTVPGVLLGPGSDQCDVSEGRAFTHIQSLAGPGGLRASRNHTGCQRRALCPLEGFGPQHPRTPAATLPCGRATQGWAGKVWVGRRQGFGLRCPRGREGLQIRLGGPCCPIKLRVGKLSL